MADYWIYIIIKLQDKYQMREIVHQQKEEMKNRKKTSIFICMTQCPMSNKYNLNAVILNVVRDLFCFVFFLLSLIAFDPCLASVEMIKEYHQVCKYGVTTVPFLS